MPPVHRFRPDKWIARPRRRGDRVRTLRETLAFTQAQLWEARADRNRAIEERNRWANGERDRGRGQAALRLLVMGLAAVCLTMAAQLLWREVQK